MKAILKSRSFPNKNVHIEIGGSKSESNRLLVLQALFPNISIKNLSESDDTLVLQQGLKAGNGTIDVHHAGTAMRFLTAYFAAKEGTEIILTGSKRMQERPIGILVDALKSLGSDIEYLKKEGFPPLKIAGRSLSKNTVRIKADVSSQYISALMLIAPTLPTGLCILLEGEVTSTPYIEMTLSLLKKIGIEVSFEGNEIRIFPKKTISDTLIAVESDWSSASYFYSLTALSTQFEIQLSTFAEHSIQGDSALSEIYKIFGVETKFRSIESDSDGERNIIVLSKQKIQLPASLVLDLSNTPDLAQTLAVSCFGLGIGCHLSGLHTLKIKEADRLVALKTELEKLGAAITIDDNSLYLEKSSTIHSGCQIDTYQDHRMAMAFAPLSIRTNITVNNADVVSKSYPNFWIDIEKTGIEVDLQD